MKKAKRAMLTVAAMAAAAMMCVTAAACGTSDPGPSGSDERWNIAEFVAQTDAAKATYDGISRGIAEHKTAIVPSAAVFSAAYGDPADGGASLDEIRSLIYSAIPDTGEVYNNTDSYISDIFTYSRLQLALMEEYESESLIGTYAVTYDWSGFDRDPSYAADQVLGLMVAFQKTVAPDTASFPGAEEETGRTYISQTHMGGDIAADLEYYYDEETGEMGTTTINYHRGGHFEYHFCEANEDFVLFVTGSYDDERNVTLDDGFAAYTRSGMLRCTSGSYDAERFGKENIELIMGYVRSEIDRIEKKIDELEAENAALAEAAGYVSPEEQRSVLVTPDISVLKEMLGR